jgi:hypothetical protein
MTMVLHHSFPRPHDVPPGTIRRHLVSLDLPAAHPRRYADSVRANRLFTLAVSTVVIAIAAGLAFTFGQALHQFLIRVGAVVFLLALVAFVVAVAVDTLKGQDA